MACLLLSFDRLGIKPFYYYFDGEQFMFASEIKAIVTVESGTRQINYPYLARFLSSSLLDYGDQTFFKEIKSLPSAHYLVLARGAKEIKLEQYWDIVPDRVRSNYNYGQSEESFLNLLSDAVCLRLRSDVPVGTCLSGGLDSSSIVALASKMLPHPMNSFSSIYPHPGYSEEKFIHIASEASGTNSHVTCPDPLPFFSLLRRITWYMDEPAAGPGIYSQWFVMELASQFVTVLLDGQGGDELFAGYFPYLPLHLQSLAHKALRGRSFALLARLVQDVFVLLLYSHSYFFPELSLRQFAGKVVSHISGSRKMDLLSPEMVAAQHQIRIPEHNPISIQDPLNRKLYQDIRQTSIPALLHYEDRNSMAFGMEARVPFLDHRLVEFALSLPSEVKIHGCTTKYFMRQSLVSVLPEPIRLRRDKMGYPTPLALWLRRPLKAEADDLLQYHFHHRKLYETSAVQRMWQEHQAGTADYSWDIFRWLTTEMWFQNFID
jgi:asparagine synthase (glutamine-hydrolysing)